MLFMLKTVMVVASGVRLSSGDGCGIMVVLMFGFRNEVLDSDSRLFGSGYVGLGYVVLVSSHDYGFGSIRVKPGQHMLRSVNNSQPDRMWVRVNTSGLAVRGSVRLAQLNRVDSAGQLGQRGQTESTQSTGSAVAGEVQSGWLGRFSQGGWGGSVRVAGEVQPGWLGWNICYSNYEYFLHGMVSVRRVTT
uniref:Uncharacterized protein n=1 Tax=Helianthus annuus TaxID=4232 RepID=A0A251SQJ7_HELAN